MVGDCVVMFFVDDVVVVLDVVLYRFGEYGDFVFC